MVSVTFDFSNQTVGPKKLAAALHAAASQPVHLVCCGSTFPENVELADVTFASLDCTGAKFLKRLTLARAQWTSDIKLDEITAKQLSLDLVKCDAPFYLRGAAISGLLDVRDCTFGGYFSADNTEARTVRIHDARFAGSARFRSVVTRDAIRFRRARFAGALSFHRAACIDLVLEGCDIDGQLHLNLERCGSLDLTGSTIGAARDLELRATRLCSLVDVIFEEAVSLRVDAPVVDARGLSVRRGFDAALARGSSVDLTRASLDGVSLLTSCDAPPASPPARVQSVASARIEAITLRGLDLTSCDFSQANSLEAVNVEGRGQLAEAPRIIQSLHGREVLFDEARWRHADRRRRYPHSPTGWWSPAVDDGEVAPPLSKVADTYRALRRARETSRDSPGAADFYYGEMEMRRHGTSSIGERLLLSAYWLSSGYGLRAVRALCWYLALVLALTTIMRWVGVEGTPRFSDTLAYVVASSTVFARPPTDIDLTTAGAFIQIVARLAGPVFFGLMVLAVRARVRR